MKAITLWQPWASLIALKIKSFETRGWATKYRGAIAIHAGKKVVPFARAFGKQPEHVQAFIREKLNEAYGSYDNLPLGAVVGHARITGVVKTEMVINQIEEVEYACGDYSQGRFAWALKDAKHYEHPVPANGAQGLWNWNEQCAKI